MRTPWELDVNTLGTAEKEIKKINLVLLLHPPQKKKPWAHSVHATCLIG
jgi:hypothetical protein